MLNTLTDFTADAAGGAVCFALKIPKPKEDEVVFQLGWIEHEQGRLLISERAVREMAATLGLSPATNDADYRTAVDAQRRAEVAHAEAVADKVRAEAKRKDTYLESLLAEGEVLRAEMAKQLKQAKQDLAAAERARDIAVSIAVEAEAIVEEYEGE